MCVCLYKNPFTNCTVGFRIALLCLLRWQALNKRFTLPFVCYKGCGIGLLSRKTEWGSIIYRKVPYFYHRLFFFQCFTTNSESSSTPRWQHSDVGRFPTHEESTSPSLLQLQPDYQHCPIASNQPQTLAQTFTSAHVYRAFLTRSNSHHSSLQTKAQLLPGRVGRAPLTTRKLASRSTV